MAQAWTSRQRLLTAFTCGIPDRVPVNTYELAGFNSRDWYNRQPSYARLMDYIRQHSDCITNWSPSAGNRYIDEAGVFLQSAYPLPIDTQVQTLPDGHTRTTRIAHTPRGDLRQVVEVDPTVHTAWTIEHWCKSTDDVDKALSVPYEPPSFNASQLPRLREELGDHGIILASLADPAYAAADLMSFQDYTLWAFSETEHFARAVDEMTQRIRQNLHNMLDTCVVDAYRICGPEYMTPPYLPPEFFRRFMLPHLTWMTDMIHRRKALVRLHCHGKIAQVLDMILDSGPDGIDPCEPPPDGDLPLDQVKQRCAARRVSVWGNLELKLLENASPAQIRQEVRQVMDQAKEGGGFGLLPTAAPINIPLSPRTQDNYIAMIDAAREFGRY